MLKSDIATLLKLNVGFVYDGTSPLMSALLTAATVIAPTDVALLLLLHQSLRVLIILLHLLYLIL